MQKWNAVVASAVAVGAAQVACPSNGDEWLRAVVASQRAGGAPTPPPPETDEPDEIGMGATQGHDTRLRCALQLANPRSQVYELSHERSGEMPMSPFGAPVTYSHHPSAGLPFTRHAFNGETVAGEVGAQGTQMDALGHFGVLDEPWDPTTPFPTESIRYYGGFTQAEVKPNADSPLLRLGIEKAPPIVTSAVLLDARTYLGGGSMLEGGQRITADDIEGMLEAQGLARRGLLPGDVLYVYTGWEDLWQDPDVLGEYYTEGPGLSVDAVLLLEEKRIVLVGLDNPFTDPVTKGQFEGQVPPPPDTPPGLPFFVHHHNLTQAGIHQIQNAHLEELAAAEVWTSCTIVLPLRDRGAAGSPVRPIAIGGPRH